MEGTENTAVYWQVLGSGDDQRLIIQWHEVVFYWGPLSGEITFQAVLREADNSIQFNYLDLDCDDSGAGGAGATVGVTAGNAQGDGRLLVCYDDGPNGYVGTGQSMRILPMGARFHAVALGPGEISGQLNFGNRREEPADVAGRHVFYNGSALDNRDPAPDAADDLAVAPDKQALLPGQTATFANYTSYSRGINGIMVDIAKAPGEPVASNFVFRAGDDNDPSAWAPGPDPQSITVRSGAGSGGSDRVTIVWADNAINNRWLQVTVVPSLQTGLAVPDVFYFGNLASDFNGDWAVTDLDLTEIAVNWQKTVTPMAGGDADGSGFVDDLDITALAVNWRNVLAVLSAPAGTATAEGLASRAGAAVLSELEIARPGALGTVDALADAASRLRRKRTHFGTVRQPRVSATLSEGRPRRTTRRGGSAARQRSTRRTARRGDANGLDRRLSVDDSLLVDVLAGGSLSLPL